MYNSPNVFLAAESNIEQNSNPFQYSLALKKLEDDAIRHSNKIVFIDTEAIVTQFYCKLYEGKEDPAINEIIKRQNYDLWLYLESDVNWVEDGLRKNGSEENRENGKMLLRELLEKNNILGKVSYVYGNYEERLDRALRIIQDEFGF